MAATMERESTPGQRYMADSEGIDYPEMTNSQCGQATRVGTTVSKRGCLQTWLTFSTNTEMPLVRWDGCKNWRD
jgi:hypothetical protein